MENTGSLWDGISTAKDKIILTVEENGQGVMLDTGGSLPRLEIRRFARGVYMCCLNGYIFPLLISNPDQS